MAATIDHFMYGVPSIERGMHWTEQTFGVAPQYGGEHIGMGTCNALLSLGETYLELIAPDPAQQVSGGLGEKLAALSEPGLITWAARGDLAAILSVLTDRGVAAVGPSRTQRKTREGQLLVWDLLFPKSTSWGGVAPFYIDWLECTHPSTTNPMAGKLLDFAITTPDADALSGLLSAIGLTLSISEGQRDMQVRVQTDTGVVVLSSTPETRLITMR